MSKIQIVFPSAIEIQKNRFRYTITRVGPAPKPISVVGDAAKLTNALIKPDIPIRTEEGEQNFKAMRLNQLGQCECAPEEDVRKFQPGIHLEWLRKQKSRTVAVQVQTHGARAFVANIVTKTADRQSG